ncbi:MAG: N-formylglutamate amidohydrolase [Planctomycetia bacterium]|nr:N-formylglutamate amidohydrolase [Planctomycetia bacterium]
MARSLVLVLALCAPLRAADKIPDGMLTRQTGELPILLSAPHGGRKPIPDCPVRAGKNVPLFVTVNDTNTDLLARKVADEIEKAMKAKPYLVIAHFERKYADVNRPEANGVEHAAAKPYYRAYHEFLKDSRAAIQKDWGRGLVIDLHGQAADANAIFRGTNNLQTTKHLVDRFGKTALTGKTGFFGLLAKAGYTITPANDADAKEDPRFSGGYIVATYGSKTDGSVDAIQLELGGQVRTRIGMDPFAKNLAAAIATFAKEYLPAEKKTK